MMTTRTLGLSFSSWILVVGCSAAPAPDSGLEAGGTGGGIVTSGGSGGSTGGSIVGSGGSIVTAGSSGNSTVDPNDTRDLPIRTKTCDTAGNCTCLRLALLGTLTSAADETDTQPFVDWLNTNSGGTAVVTMVSTKPTLDAAWLSGYDILVIANVNGWAFSADEKAAVDTWSRETGGGIISLTGFVSEAAEPADTSQLISFAGYGYNSTTTAMNGQSYPVYYQGGTTDLKNCLSWTGSSTAIITTPIKFTPQTGGMEKLTLALDYVGAFIGWGVTPPAGAVTVATDPISGQPMASAFERDGTGRLLVWGDEWVIFANQWLPVGNPHNMQMDMYNPCWNAATSTFHSVQTLYQTKQFWYNAISWVAPPNECGFIVDDPDVVVR
jgi:hypothetical protein